MGHILAIFGGGGGYCVHLPVIGRVVDECVVVHDGRTPAPVQVDGVNEAVLYQQVRKLAQVYAGRDNYNYLFIQNNTLQYDTQ